MVKHHGVHFLEKKQAKLRISETNKNDAKLLLGPPSTQNTFDNDLWILDPRKDYLIKIFEEIFFMEAAILIGILTLSSSIIFLLFSNIINLYFKKDQIE